MKTVYVCGIDWQHEIGHASDGNVIYPSVASLKKYHEAAKGCGIVECQLTFVRWMEKQDIKKMGSIPVEDLNAYLIKNVKKKIASYERYLAKLEAEEAR